MKQTGIEIFMKNCNICCYVYLLLWEYIALLTKLELIFFQPSNLIPSGKGYNLPREDSDIFFILTMLNICLISNIL